MATSPPPLTVTGDEADGFVADLVAARALSLDNSRRPLRLEVVSAVDVAEGAFELDATVSSAEITATVRGGTRSGAVYGVRQLFDHLAADPAPGPVSMTVSPALPHRIFWTWDHSTNWDLLSVGQQESGAFNGYEKQPECFVDGYQRLIDFMSANRVGGLVVYGLLRDGHGGVETAKSLCAYARDRGVRLIAGIAANSYGGIYYEGDHDYNLATWLDRHPELEASFTQMPGFHIDDYGRVPFPKGPLSRAGRSEARENLQWTLEGIDWLIETVQPGGINIEFGDYAGSDPVADMRAILPSVLDRVASHDPNLPVITDVGWDSLLDPELPGKFQGLPPECIYEFTFNRSYWNGLREQLNPKIVQSLPMHSTILRGQIGTQWNKQRYSYLAPDFADLARVACDAGMEGISMFSEVSDFSAPNEFNYLAFARFGYEKDLTWNRFVTETIEPALGGPVAAHDYLEAVTALNTEPNDGELDRLAQMAHHGAAVSTGDARRRWVWLEHKLLKRLHWQQVSSGGAW